MYLLIDFEGYDETKLTLPALKDIENLLNLDLLNFYNVQNPRTIARVVQVLVSSDGKTVPKLMVAWQGSELTDEQKITIATQVEKYLEIYRDMPAATPFVVETEHSDR